MGSAQTKMYIAVGERSMIATLADNEATRRLVALLGDGPISVEMDEYGGFEKVGALPQSLPTSNSQITTVPGDIMLYQGRNMVIFYGSNSWSYTRLGKIDGATAAGLREFLGSGSVTVTLSLNPTSGISEVKVDEPKADVVYDLNGRIVSGRPLSPGVYIVNGRKTVVR